MMFCLLANILKECHLYMVNASALLVGKGSFVFSTFHRERRACMHIKKGLNS